MPGDEWMLPVAGFAALLFVVATALVSCGPAQEAGRYPVTASVVPGGDGIDIGVSVDAGRIDFGRLPARDIRAEKTVTITNNHQRTIHAAVTVTGNITQHLTVSRDTLTIPPGGTENLTVTMDLANTTMTGRYGGAVTVTTDPCA